MSAGGQRRGIRRAAAAPILLALLLMGVSLLYASCSSLCTQLATASCSCTLYLASLSSICGARIVRGLAVLKLSF